MRTSVRHHGRKSERTLTLKDAEPISLIERNVKDWLKEAAPVGAELKCEFHTHYHLPQKASQSASVAQIADDVLVKEFNERADRWERESSIHSAPGDKFIHNDYLRIIGKGEKVAPLILKRLETSKKDWLFALEHIVPEDENPAKGIEDFRKAVKAWIEWGARKYQSII